MKKYRARVMSLRRRYNIILWGLFACADSLSRMPVISGISFPKRKTFLVDDMLALKRARRLTSSLKWAPRALSRGIMAMKVYYKTRQHLSRPAPLFIMPIIFSSNLMMPAFSSYPVLRVLDAVTLLISCLFKVNINNMCCSFLFKFVLQNSQFLKIRDDIS